MPQMWLVFYQALDITPASSSGLGEKFIIPSSLSSLKVQLKVDRKISRYEAT
jgi:hypothetical protein